MRPQRSCHRRITLLFGAVLVAVAVTQSVAAKPLLNVPVYNPKTRSYFELVPITVIHPEIDGAVPAVPWGMSQGYAQSTEYKGARGRLAIVRDEETTAWVEQQFQLPTEVWIGLRYICRVRQLEWTDGQLYKKGNFQLWGRNWFQGIGGSACNGNEVYLPVALVTKEDGVHWVSYNYPKAFSFYLVEFPTGEP